MYRPVALAFFSTPAGQLYKITWRIRWANASEEERSEAGWRVSRWRGSERRRASASGRINRWRK